MEHHLPLTGEQRAKLEPLIPPPQSTANSDRLSTDEYPVLDELTDLSIRVALFIFPLQMHVEPAHAAL